MDREIAYYLLKLDLRKALIFINKIRRKLNYIINEENYDKTYNKTYNNSYWRAEKDRVYFTIDCNFLK